MSRTIDLTDSLLRRYWPRVDKAGPVPAHTPTLGACWLWIRPGKRGYGQLSRGGRGQGFVYAHHVALAIVGRRLPRAGEHTDHLCRNPTCVNPDHLEVVSHRENLRRSPTVKLSPGLVERIKASPLSGRALARQLGVSHRTVNDARAGRSWA